MFNLPYRNALAGKGFEIESLSDFVPAGGQERFQTITSTSLERVKGLAPDASELFDTFRTFIIDAIKTMDIWTKLQAKSIE